MQSRHCYLKMATRWVIKQKQQPLCCRVRVKELHLSHKTSLVTSIYCSVQSAKFPNVKTVTREVQTRAQIPTLLRRQVHVVNAHKHSNTYTQTCILHTSHWCTLCVLHCRYFICSHTDRRIDVYCANVSDSEQSNTISETGGEQKCMWRNV